MSVMIISAVISNGERGEISFMSAFAIEMTLKR